MKYLPMREEHDLASELLELGRDQDPVLVLFAILQLLNQHAVDQGLRCDARVVSRGILAEDEQYVSIARPRAMGLVAGQCILGLQGEKTWQEICATHASNLGVANHRYEGTFRTEQFAHGLLERKSYFPDDATIRIQGLCELLRARQQAHLLEQTIPAHQPGKARSRL